MVVRICKKYNMGPASWQMLLQLGKMLPMKLATGSRRWLDLEDLPYFADIFQGEPANK